MSWVEQDKAMALLFEYLTGGVPPEARQDFVDRYGSFFPELRLALSKALIEHNARVLAEDARNWPAR